MDKKFLESLLSKVKNPARVCINDYSQKYYGLISAENTNDTLGWFHINSNVVEEELQKRGFSWCYVFETAPKQSPMIYMFFGKGLSKELLGEDFKDIENSLPKGRSIYYEEQPFRKIDIDRYDDSITELEKELHSKASDIFRVYEA